jgi:exopolyphosphatase/guanosine-5'-triphosphate,3'-diphosphate pyrophosphatase
VDRVIDAVQRSAAAARSLHVDQLFAFATSAVRDATNGAEIADRLARETGIQPRFLTGEEEARLTYLAVRRWYGWSAGRLLVVDIGGGSMEIALGRDATPDFAVSLPLGAGRLTRAFLHDDPPRREQLRDLRHHARATLREVSDRLRWDGDPKRVIASSKTFSSSPGSRVPHRNGPVRSYAVPCTGPTSPSGPRDWRSCRPASELNCVECQSFGPSRSPPGRSSPRQ